MKETKIILSNIQDVRDFVNIVVLLEYEVDLAQGRYLIVYRWGGQKEKGF